MQLCYGLREIVKSPYGSFNKIHNATYKYGILSHPSLLAITGHHHLITMGH